MLTNAINQHENFIQLTASCVLPNFTNQVYINDSKVIKLKSS